MLRMLESYFHSETASMEITIEQEYFSLEFPRNMLNVLLYLKESIFFEIDQKDVLVLYGEMLVQWKQFEVLAGLIYTEQIP